MESKGKTDPNESRTQPREESRGSRGLWRLKFSGPRVLKWLVSTAAVVVFAVLSLMLTVHLAAVLFVDANLIRTNLVHVVESQTGGRLAIERLEYDALRGLRIRGISLFPPLPSDPTGHPYGGPVDSRPLFHAEGISLDYQLLDLFRGKATVNGINLIRPRLFVEDVEGVQSFGGILAYRKKHFPPGPEVPDPAPPPDPDEEAPLFPELPIKPSSLYLPFVTISASKIGVEDIGLRYRKVTKGKQEIDASVEGLSVELGGDWEGFSSRFFLSLTSVGTGLQISADLPEDQMEASFELEKRFEIFDFAQIHHDLHFEMTKLESKLPELPPLNLSSKLRAKIHSNYQGLEIEEILVDLQKALEYRMSGSVAAVPENPSEIDLNLTQKFSVVIDRVMGLARPFVKNIEAGGRIEMEDLTVEGRIDPRKLAKDPSVGLPLITMRLVLEEVQAFLPEAGAQLDPLNGYLSVSMTKSPSGQGSQIDTVLDLINDGARVEKKTKLGRTKASIQSLQTNVIVRALYPQMVVPILKVSVESPEIKAQSDQIKNISVPLRFALDGEADQELNKVAVDLDMRIGKILDVALGTSCRSQCTDSRLEARMRVPSLAKVFALAYPLAEPLGLGKKLPTKLAGSISAQANIEASLPPPLKTPTEKLIKETEADFDVRFEVDDLDLKVPMMTTDLRGFTTKLQLLGNRESQKIDIRTGYERFSLVPPDKKADSAGEESVASAKSDKKNPIKTGRFHFDLSVRNQIAPGTEIKEIHTATDTSITMRTGVSEIEAEGILPTPLSRVGFSADIRQVGLREFSIKKILADIPDFGLRYRLKARTALGEDQFPQKVYVNNRLTIDHSSGKSLPGGVSTTGKMIMASEITSERMEEASFQAKVSFDEFSLNLKNAKGETLADVTGVSGQFPIFQRLKIKKFIDDLKAKQKASQKSDTKDAVESLPIAEEREQESSKIDAYLTKKESDRGRNKNLVALVDYPTVRPFFRDKNPISIEKIEAANLEIEEIEFDVEVRQNIFALNQFSMKFLDGKIQGGFQLLLDSASEEPMEILKSAHASLHMTKLNSHKLIERFPDLRDKKGFSLLGSDPFIAGTVHLKYDFPTSDMGGGINITSIGKEQLRMMLYYVDPKEEDPTIGQIRTALNFGDVKLVSIPIKNGEIGMEIDVRLLAVLVPLPKISKIPISQIVRNFQGTSAGDTEKGEEDSEEFDDEFSEPRI